MVIKDIKWINLRKYLNYVLEKESFKPKFDDNVISARALSTAKLIRDNNREPAIIIHGIMKRSGTVYIGQILSLHPEIISYPNRIWEVPFLPLTETINKLQREFFYAYKQNMDVIGRNDFLPLFGAAFIRYLFSSVPVDKKMLIKVPSVQYLSHFYSVFPEEYLLLLIRDGRDIVTSTIKTWPQISFISACRRWEKSSRMVLACMHRFEGKKGFWLARYEDAVTKPEVFVREACQKFDLDPSAYPFEEIGDLPVIGSSTTAKTRTDKISWMKKTEHFKPIGRWQQWSPLKKALFKLIGGKSLMKLGYCDQLNW